MKITKIALQLVAGGCAALMFACSDSSSSPEPNVSGSTNEPNAGPIASDTTENQQPVVDLPEDRVAILEKSFDIFKGPKPSYTEDSFGDPVNSDDGMWIEPDSQFVYIMEKIIVPFGGWGGGRSQYRYMSEDRLRECFVESDSSGSAVYSTREYQKNPRFLNGFLYEHWESIESARYTVEDGDTVVIKSVGTGVATSGFWGLDYSCAEFLQNFKDDCKKQNGLFKDFGDGCRNGKPIVSCAFFLPEGSTTQSYIDNYEQELIDFCKEDSLWYAPKDDPAHTPGGCEGGGNFSFSGEYDSWQKCHYVNGDEINLDDYTDNRQIDSVKAAAYDLWRDTLTLTSQSYREQFAVYREMVNGMLHLYNPDLGFGEGVAYNSFPQDPRAESFKEEGMYPLPDSLVGLFFPEMVKNPFWGDSVAISSHQYKERSTAYYMVVLKDVGAKGHGLTKITADSVLVSDIVKIGNCPEDAEIHYAVFLVAGNTEWNVSNKTVYHKAFDAPLWDCGKPESLDNVDPYREWVSELSNF